MVPDERDWYDTPLYYDIVFDAGTATEADFLEAVYRRHGPAISGRSRPRLLEPACGSGRLAAEMARRNWDVSGFDANATSLSFARQRIAEAGLKARLWRDRLESFVVPGRADFDLAHCLVSTFKYLLTENDARSHLRRVGDSLHSGGLYVLGLHLVDYSRTRHQHERWLAIRNGVEVVCNTRTFPPDRSRRLEALRCRLSIRENARLSRQETHWQFRTYDARQLRQTLRAALPEFTIAACHYFNHDPEITREFDDAYPDLIVVLKKSG